MLVPVGCAVETVVSEKLLTHATLSLGESAEALTSPPPSPYATLRLRQVGQDARAGFVLALQRRFADEQEGAAVRSLGQLFLLPLAQPQDAPELRIDHEDVAIAHVAARR